MGFPFNYYSEWEVLWLEKLMREINTFSTVMVTGILRRLAQSLNYYAKGPSFDFHLSLAFFLHREFFPDKRLTLDIDPRGVSPIERCKFYKRGVDNR